MPTTAAQDKTLTTWRCRQCKRVLMELELKAGTVKKICERCKTENIITAG